MTAGAAKKLARINGRGHARGWHAQQLHARAIREGRGMADLFLDSLRDTCAFTVPAEAVRMRRRLVVHRFSDGSEAEI